MAEPIIAAPASYKQPSRKGKKAWRKNVDITEVQTGLETVRDELIKGGVIAEKSAEELFTTDLQGDEVIAKQQEGKKLLKADEIIAQRSTISGLDGRKRKLADTVITKSSKRHKNGTYVSHKELQRLKEIADRADGGLAIQDKDASYDPWTVTPVVKDSRFDFLEEERAPQEPKTLKHAPKSLAINGKSIPNVRKPEAGKSYNPLAGDWHAILSREGEAVVKDEEKRLAEEAKAAEQEAKALAEAAKVEAAEKAEYATDYDSAWESEWDGFASGAEEETHVQKQKRRKTAAERNKIKARKEKEAREKWEQKQKLRNEQLTRIKQIAKEASLKEKNRKGSKALTISQQESSDASSDDGVEPQIRRRRFGQLPLPHAPLEVVLPDELQDSLRRLKPEGNLLTDRYRNMLLNGKIEMRKQQWQRKQAKTERFEKWSYKDWKLR